MADEVQQTDVMVGDCRFGKGVFAARRFLPREEILRFRGPEIDLSTVLTKGVHAGDPLQIGIDRYLDLEAPGSLVNHSCKPNAGISQNNTLIAIKEISQGEEIFYDYSTTMGDGGWTMVCECGSDECRTIITDFHHLPPLSQRAYLDAGVVQTYLVEKLVNPIRPTIDTAATTSHERIASMIPFDDGLRQQVGPPEAVLSSPDEAGPSELLELTRDLLTPCLVIDRRVLRKNIAELRSSITGADLWYAVKANPHPSVVSEMIRHGIGLEIASPHELELSLAMGGSPTRIICLHPIKSQAFIAQLRDAGVTTMAVDTADEIEKIARIAPGSQILVRIDVDLTGSGSRIPLGEKFGCSISEGLNLSEFSRQQGLIPAGVTLHVGSQCESLTHWQRSLEDCRDFCRLLCEKGLSPQWISLGGGLPVPYEITGKVPHWSEIGAIINSVDFSSAVGADCTITIEPGRAVVATAGALVASVLGTAHRNGSHWLHLDAGIYQGLMEWLPVCGGLRMPVTSARRESPIRHYRIGGPTCDSLDVLPGKIPLPLMSPGDRLIFHCAGAYSAAISTRFNGFDAPQVFVIDEKGVCFDE